MPNCAAFGCTSGYDKSVKSRWPVTWHSFPLKNTKLRDKWVKNLSRKDFVPNEHTRLCSLHFKEEDYVTVTQDKRKRNLAARNSPTLKKRRLKPTAYPTVFSQPKYLLKKKTPEKRSSSARTTASARRLFEDQQQVAAGERAMDADLLRDLDDLETRLNTDPCVPKGFCFTRYKLT